MRTHPTFLALTALMLTGAGSAAAEDGVPARTFTPQLPMTATAQPVEVTPAASSDGEFPSGAMIDTQTLALPLAQDDDEQ